jgi:hypothetical protein
MAARTTAAVPSPVPGRVVPVTVIMMRVTVTVCHGARTQLELEGNTKLYGPAPPAGPGPGPGTRMTEPEGAVIVIPRLLVVTEYNPGPTDTGSVAASLSDVSMGRRPSPTRGGS